MRKHIKVFILITIAIISIICIAIAFINYSNNGLRDFSEWVNIGNKVYKIENGKDNSKNANKILRNSEKGEYLMTFSKSNYSSADNDYTDAKIHKLKGHDSEVLLLLEHNNVKRLLTLVKINEKQTMEEILNMYGSIDDIKNVELRYVGTKNNKNTLVKEKLNNKEEFSKLSNLLKSVVRSEEPITAQIPEEFLLKPNGQENKQESKKQNEINNIYIDINYNNYICLTISVGLQYNTNAIYMLGMDNCFILTKELLDYLYEQKDK